eukprot:1128400-Rhodomonas_salina.2
MPAKSYVTLHIMVLRKSRHACRHVPYGTMRNRHESQVAQGHITHAGTSHVPYETTTLRVRSRSMSA